MSNVSNFPNRHLQPFHVSTPTKWQGVEPPKTKWIVDGAIPRGAVCLFSGPGSSGKSYLDLQLQVATALGMNWLGMAVRPCKTFAIYGEDSEVVIHQRVHAICRHYGAQKGDLDDMRFIGRNGSGDNDMTLFECNKFKTLYRFTAVFQQLFDYVVSNGIEIVMLDTVARVFAGDGNVQSHVVGFLTGLEKLATAIDGAVILNIHPSKAQDSTYSGNTQWEALVRSHLHLKRPKNYDPENPDADHGSRILRNVKANWGPLGQAIKLKWRDGVFVNVSKEEEERQNDILSER